MGEFMQVVFIGIKHVCVILVSWHIELVYLVLGSKFGERDAVGRFAIIHYSR